jgi:hypothetical protein
MEDNTTLTAQEMKMKEILQPFLLDEGEGGEGEGIPLLYEPVVIKIPIKNCQNTLVAKNLLEDLKIKQTPQEKSNNNERRSTIASPKNDQSK